MNSSATSEHSTSAVLCWRVGLPTRPSSPFLPPGAHQSTFKSASAPTPLPDKSVLKFCPSLTLGKENVLTPCFSPKGFFLPKCPFTSPPRTPLGPSLSKDLWTRQEVFPRQCVITKSKVYQGLSMAATAHNGQGAQGPRSYRLASLVHLIFFFKECSIEILEEFLFSMILVISLVVVPRA